MTAEKPVYEFLTKDDNLNYVIDLANELEHFRKEMHIQFWEKYNMLMTQKMVTSELSQLWKYSPFNLRRRRNGWERSTIRPVRPDNTRLELLFYFLQESPESNFRLIYSVRWNKKSADVKYDSPKMTILKSKLSGYKINIPSDWEFLYGYSNWRIYDACVKKYIHGCR